MSGGRRPPTLVARLNAGGALLLSGLLFGALLAGCGGGGEPVARPAETEPSQEVVAAEQAQADESETPGREEAEPEEDAADDEEEEDPGPRGPVGAIVEVQVEDLPPGFTAIPFYADIPGLLRESLDGNLAGLGLRAAVPGFSGGQGFANNDTGELIFVVTILLESAEAARAAVDYIGTREIEEVMQFVEPTDTLFDSQRQPDPILGSGGVRYSLRYGVENDERRTRDVATDLVIFGQDGSLVFLQRSVNVTGSGLSAAGEETEVDLLALGRTVAQRIAAVVQGDVPASP